MTTEQNEICKSISISLQEVNLLNMNMDHSSVMERDGAYGLPDALTFGLKKVRENVAPSHPIEESEKNYSILQERRDMKILRSVQGLHAPLQLAMERKAAKQIGRLPFLPSSNLQLEVLQGDDVSLDFSNILHPPDTKESLFVPHAVMERSLGII